MKKLQIILAVIGIFSLMSCEEMLNLGIEVESNEVTVDFEVLPTDFIGDTTLATNVIQSDFNSAIEEAGLTLEDVESIKLKEAVVEITNEDTTITFDFSEKVEATIEVDGLDEIVIASVDSIPEGARTLTCNVGDSELMDYVTAQEYIIRAKGKTVKAIEENMNIRGSLTFSIKTNVDLETE